MLSPSLVSSADCLYAVPVLFVYSMLLCCALSSNFAAKIEVRMGRRTTSRLKMQSAKVTNCVLTAHDDLQTSHGDILLMTRHFVSEKELGRSRTEGLQRRPEAD